MPLIDFGTVNTIRPGDVGGPASGLSTSSSANETDLAVYGQDQYTQNVGRSLYGTGNSKSGIYGDMDPRSGLTGSGTGYNGDDGGSIVPQTAGMEGSPAGSPVAWWFGMIVLIAALKIIAEKNGDAAEFKTIKVGALNIVIITVSSIIGLTFLKWIFGVYKIPGISQIVEAS